MTVGAPPEGFQLMRDALVRSGRRRNRFVARARSSTARLRMWPSFLVIGVPRGGTTSLHAWLTAHPQIVSARHKELHYFGSNHDRGPRWFRSQFPIWRPGRLAFEASPETLSHPLAPQRASSEIPNGRFIALLREPVRRAVSHYLYMRQLGLESATFSEALQREREYSAVGRDKVLRGEPDLGYLLYAYVRIGEYAAQLRSWFGQLDREQFLIIESEELYRRPDETFATVVGWLGLPHVPMKLGALNASRPNYEIDPVVLRGLRKHYEPLNEELFDLLGRRLWAAVPS